MMPYKQILLIILLLVIVPFICRGQKIRLYNSEEGLPNSLINKVYQDNRGYIWIATENGASYFDGMRFTTFRHDRNKPGTITSDLVKVIYTDSKGVCWVGTSTGLQVFDYKSNVFREVELVDPYIDSRFYVSSIIENHNKDRLFISIAGRGIIALDINTHEIDTVTSEMFRTNFDIGYIGNLFLDSHNILWSFAEQGNFFRFDLNEKSLERDLWGDLDFDDDNQPIVSSIIEDPLTGNLLIGTYKHGLFFYDRQLNKIRKTKGNSTSRYRIRSLLAEGRRGSSSEINIWIGTDDYGLKKYDRNTENIIDADFQLSPIDLNNCKVHSLIQDSQGNIWAGVYQKGLLIIPRSTYGFEYLKLSENQSTLNPNMACATSIVRDHSGDLWIGTDGGGLFCFSKMNGIVRYSNKNTPLQNNSIMSLTIDNYGTLWVSTYMGGITTYHPQTGFQPFSNDIELQKVFCSYFDQKRNRLYFGTLGHGVMALNLSDRKITRFPNANISGWLNSLCVDSKDQIWFGRTDGIRCYNLSTGEEIRSEINNILEGSRVYSIHEGRDGNLWFGSAEGLIRYDQEKAETQLLTKNDGLSSNLVFSIKEDKNGYIWVGTGNGLSRYDQKTRQFQSFYSYDGLQDNEFRLGASFLDADGKLFFGGINGVSAFYPSAIDRAEPIMPNIYFSRLTVLNKGVQYDEMLGKKNILDRHISQAGQITLKKNQNVFSLDFAVLEYTNPQKVVYGYMLKGFDSDWQYTDASHRSATYTNLPDGRYLFRVKAFYEGYDNEDNVVYNEIQIRILPPWYKTWWAYLIYLTLMMFAVRIFLDYLIKRRLRLQEIQEMEKKEMKLRMFTDMSHEIRTPLTLVMTPLKSMRESETDARKKEMYNLMYRNVLRILRLINQLMDIRKIDNHQLKLHFNKTDLIFFVQDIMKSFEQLAIMRNIDFRLVSNLESLEVWIDQGNFDKVLFNVLSNAFKYTPDNGYVLISIDTHRTTKHGEFQSYVAEYVELRIENSGSKIDDSHLERIFERFYQGNNDNIGGSGIGLHLARMITRLHHGTIKAKNIDNGVVFVVQIPLGDTHLSPDEKSTVAKHKDLYYSIRPDEKLPEQSEYIELTTNDEDEQAAKISKSKRNVVFVDDDADLGRYIRMELSDKYNIETFTDAREAWKIISTKVPDAVITDLMMPELDGNTLCRKIRQNPETNHIPVIILTSQTDEESERQCIENGADRYLTKPVGLDLLKSTVAQAIQTRETIKNKYRASVGPDYESIQISSPDSRLIAKVIEAIKKNIENPEFSVDDLSREVGMSRVHLNRKLKENINVSPNNLIKSIRLKQAAYLLIKNKVNVSDVAYKVGFSSHSYFSNNFREYFGMAPSEFVAKYMDSDDKETLNKLFEH